MGLKVRLVQARALGLAYQVRPRDQNPTLGE